MLNSSETEGATMDERTKPLHHILTGVINRAIGDWEAATVTGTLPEAVSAAILALLPGRTEAEVKAEAWDEGYWQGVDDARTADELQVDIGLGHGIYAQPARQNPYRDV